MEGIDWKDQCQFCTKGINTTYCYEFSRNIDAIQQFMKEHRFNEEHIEVEVRCKFFGLDKKKVEQSKQNENE